MAQPAGEEQPITRDEVIARHAVMSGQSGRLVIARDPRIEQVYHSLLRDVSHRKDRRWIEPRFNEIYGLLASDDQGWYRLLSCDALDLFWIENAGMMVAYRVLSLLDRRIKATGSARIIRQRRSDPTGSLKFEHDIKRQALGDNFGAGQRRILIIDPTIATGTTIMTAIEIISNTCRARGVAVNPGQFLVWSILASPVGAAKICDFGATLVVVDIGDGIDEYGFTYKDHLRPPEVFGDLEQILKPRS